MTPSDNTVRPSKSPKSGLLKGVLGLALATLAIAPTFGQAPTPAKNPKPVKVAKPTTPAGAHAYDIPILSDVAFSQPSNQWSYFFELRPGVKLVGANQYIDINYLASALLKSTEGSVTIYLNGIPVESHRMGAGASLRGLWHIPLPLRLFKPGAFNEIRVISRQRTTDGPCKDFDNAGNWLTFPPGSRLHLVRLDPPVFPLYSYPFPYLDSLETNPGPVRSSWVVPTGAKPSLVGEALSLASDWGLHDIVHGLDIKLGAGSDRPGQNIMFGGDASGGSLGSLANTSGGGPDRSRLTIGGSTDQGVHAARRTLADPLMVDQLRGFRASVDNDPAQEARTATTRLGSFSFTELGFPVIQLRGAYHQQASLSIQRPVRVDLGRESYITIHFRHSATLNSLRSILTIAVNGVNIGSARLDDSNANGGSIKFRIPVTELAKNIWHIDLMAYHDLASVDCSRTYDEVAWTVVEGDSSLELNTGAISGRPYLDAFPYLVGKDGMSPDRVPIALSSSQSDAQLSAAAG